MNTGSNYSLYVALAFILMGAGFLTACSQETQSFEERIEDLYSYDVSLIKSHELRDKLKHEDTVYLLDTRTPEEYQVSHLQHSQRVGYDDFEKKAVDHIPKDATVVTYCTVGYRSDKIGKKLKAMGYKNVHNLYGSLINWVNAGYPVHSPEGESTSKLHTHSEDWAQYLEGGKAVYE